MLPEKLYIIREILKEFDMSYGMDYLKTVYSELLRQSTRDLYEAGDVEAYKHAVRFEIRNNFSTTLMAQEMTKDLAEKIKLHMHLTNRNAAFVALQTGLSRAVIDELLEGRGSIQNFLTVMMSVGWTLQSTDINGFHKQYVEEEQQKQQGSVAVISPITREDYALVQNILNDVRDYSEIGGNLQFNMTPIGTDVIVTGVIDYKLTEEEAESNEFKIATKEFLVSVMIYPELREKLVADFLKKPNAIAMSLGGKYIITVEQLLNSLYQLDGDDAYYMLIRIPYRLRSEEELMIADAAYVITLNVNGVATSSTVWVSRDNITFKGMLVDENGEPIPDENNGDNEGQIPDTGGNTGTEQPGDSTDGSGTEPSDPNGTGDGNEPQPDGGQGTTPEPTNPPTGESSGEQPPENDGSSNGNDVNAGGETQGGDSPVGDGTGTNPTVPEQNQPNGEGETGNTTQEGTNPDGTPPIEGQTEKETTGGGNVTGETTTPDAPSPETSNPDSGTGGSTEPTPDGNGTTSTQGTEVGGETPTP